MRNEWRGAFAVVLELAAIGMSLAWAGEGLIQFSGAVVTPTCGAGAATRLPGEVDAPARVFSCGTPAADGGGGDAGNPSTYRREVIRLNDHESLPLLRQFGDQAASASSTGQRPLLVVQTYD